MKRRLFWLRHKLIHWVNRFSNDELEVIAWFSLMFLVAAYYWWVGVMP